MAKQQQFETFDFIPPMLESKVFVLEKDYHELLMIKGKYEELKAITDRIFSLLTPNEVKGILKLVHLYRRDKRNKI